jgi:hypothetical protein
MAWCIFEAGQFWAKLLSESRGLELDKQQRLVRSRLVTIYDADRPGPLDQYHATRVTSTDRFGNSLFTKKSSSDRTEAGVEFEETDVFKLLTDIIKSTRYACGERFDRWNRENFGEGPSPSDHTCISRV